MILATAGLISFGSWLVGKLADKGFDKVFDELTDGPKTLNEKFYEAVSRAADKLQRKNEGPLSHSIEYLFKQEKTFSELIKLLFSESKIRGTIIKTQFDTDTLPAPFVEEFIQLIKHEVLLDPQLGAIFRNNQIYVLLQGLNFNLEKLVETSTLTNSEVRKIHKIIEQTMGEHFSLNEFIRTYRETSLRVLSQVNFIGLGVDSSVRRKKKVLQDIFIKPFFRPYERKPKKENIITDDEVENEKKSVSYKKLFDVDRNRLVILGNPGSGKSVLIRSLICDILSDKGGDHHDKSLGNYLPFRIELRKYLAFKKSNRGNILKYLSTSLEEELNIRNITEPILHELFTTCNVVVFFDGLDEIFRLKDKIDIKNDIENFHSIYPKIRSLTTSRVIGYDEASLDNNVFFEMRILNFNDRQIDEYVRKWYLKEEDDENIRNKEVDQFLRLRRNIDDELIRNPLLLSLIVILYRNILKIPESKLEIYQSCTKTLVDKWDAEKDDLQIDLDTRIYREKDKILSDLAYWQYEELSKGGAQISYDKAKGTVVKTLRSKLNVADDAEAEDLSEKFMDYVQKRSIYFDNNFTHKTFLEYYTAYWIYSNIEKKHKPGERDNLLEKYIGQPFWYIVLELLLNMIDKDQPDTEIIDAIFERQLSKGGASQFMLVVLPTLKNISQPQTRY